MSSNFKEYYSFLFKNSIPGIEADSKQDYDEAPCLLTSRRRHLAVDLFDGTADDGH